MSNKAIFTGTLAVGFSLVAVVSEQVAEAQVAKVIRDCDILAEALEILDPASKDKRYALSAEDLVDEPFQYYIALRGASALGGIEVYGPFVDITLAEDFGASKLIEEGYNQGELCVIGDDGETEYRGWWNIE